MLTSSGRVLQGNAYFKEGKYEAAVECYSAGMEADGTNALLPANRAMALLKLERSVSVPGAGFIVLFRFE